MRNRHAIAVLLLPALFSACATDLGYLWKQGGCLISSNTGTKDIASMVKDPKTPADTRIFLEKVRDIKGFAVKEIGLKENANFTRYKEIGRNYLVSVVQACDAVSFSAYYWRYPFLGKLPYKGFYEPADAKAEADRLKGEGFDVIVRKVDAFSTLGFFSDPVYSFMGKYSLFDLASLIIHEQTHATVFLNGQAEFNEELASFMGDQGAKEYIASRFGRNSAEYEESILHQEDFWLFLQFIRELRTSLEEVYSGELPREEKLARKGSLISEYQRRFKSDYAPRFKSPSYREKGELTLNNAYISLYEIYSGDRPLLESYYTIVCGSDLRAFMDKVKTLAGARGDMKERMRKEVGGAGNP